MDCWRRWMWRYASRPEIDHGWKWIATGYGLMTGGGLPVVDDRRWISGDESRETDDNQSPSLSWRYWGYTKLYTSRDYLLWFQARKLQWSTDTQIQDVLPVVSFQRIRYWPLLRALFRDTKWCTYMHEFQCRIQSQIRSRVTARMPLAHKPYEINLWRRNDL